MKTLVNTDIKMTKKMLNALTLFETYCVGKMKNETNEEEVKEFLIFISGKDLADKFKPEYLY